MSEIKQYAEYLAENNKRKSEMIKYQYLRQGDLALTIATELDRKNNVAFYSFCMKHPKDRFVKRSAREVINECPMYAVDIDDDLTRNELLLAVLCDIYAKERLNLPPHYRVYVLWLMMEYNEKVLMGL